MTKYGKFDKVHKFKYLGDIMLANRLERDANSGGIIRRRELSGWLIMSTTKNACPETPKIRFYNTKVKPESSYTTEKLTINRIMENGGNTEDKNHWDRIRRRKGVG